MTIRLVDTLEDARDMRRTFQDKEPRHERRVGFTWPDELQLVGRCLAIEYRSDKWQREKDYEDYKHIAEAPQDFLACADLIVPHDDPSRPLAVHGPWLDLPRTMPRHFAVLAPSLGCQVKLYKTMRGNRGYYGREDDGVMQLRLPRAMLGGARVPKSGEAFLFFYSPGRADGVHAMVFGSSLDVEKDGLSG